MNMTQEEPSVTVFREFLRIRTDHPTPDYEGSTKFLVEKAKQYGLQCEVFRETGLPIVIMKIEGEDPTLPAVLLNSHVDVVPAVFDHWKVNPFEAYKDEEGNIFARGTQDMKCVTIQFLEVAARFVKSGKKFKRNLYLTFVPGNYHVIFNHNNNNNNNNNLTFKLITTIFIISLDEEIGAGQGMEPFVLTNKFKEMNIGMAIDEGLANPNDEFTVFYGERAPWWVHITAEGNTGHGSRFIEGTAVEKLLRTVNKMLQFRQDQFNELHKGHHECGKKLGDVTTLNLTVLKAGVGEGPFPNYSYNVIPTTAEAGFDIRIPPTVNLEKFLEQIREWTSEEGLSFKFANYTEKNELTDLKNPDLKWWTIFQESCSKMGVKLIPEIFPAATDSRFIRNLGIPAFGFSPINNTPILLHDHNEFLNEKTFLRGIDIYEGLIPNLANMLLKEDFKRQLF
ncbi:N-acyl-L-amino-acid amidohydrolase [Heterostelium album PN500]|uniref:N-acyl-aliphatic-L-amino acid amidohydrolase n=1 Tax=Heterostelium pallidum (strain ATCC 26659 / Pp 5 / PN500) TaxID=670386 RepID=D3B9G6_HETP5|nr:N-acyl-L-amino-acid amidohydrolase [Heterostelium album PN500]EFA81878.1 N-acyl-L-amino-acid amidohydrolase [Heterostelium album PN500]|eukprot:XP_020433995.1 N-acyl-L-amino-acid amidohydrolase [Heterostelium album PN500]